MTNPDISAWAMRHAWKIAFILVMFAGYSLGKDRALRDNARDASPAAMISDFQAVDP